MKVPTVRGRSLRLILLLLLVHSKGFDLSPYNHRFSLHRQQKALDSYLKKIPTFIGSEQKIRH